MKMHDARKDLLAGAVFMAFGLAFAVTSTTYDIGTALRMGPGFFPLVLGGVLVVLGALIAISGYLAADRSEIGTVPWRALVLLLGASLTALCVVIFVYALQLRLSLIGPWLGG
jgi:hypothetical protein